VTLLTRQRAGLGEAFVVWALAGVFLAVVCITYARIPAEELYHTSVEGLRGGLGRALVVSNFPIALVALGILGLVADRADTRRVDLACAGAAVLCAVVVLPGVVEQSDLDAKLVNAVPAAGVALALVLTVATALRRGVGEGGRVRGDGVRLVFLVLIAVAAAPWIAAWLGFYLDDVPGLGFVMASDVVPEEGAPDLRAVHLGQHHGLDGALVASASLLLSRQLGRMGRPRLRTAVAVYLALGIVYGLANLVQDFWLEQLVKRGTVDVSIPTLIQPSVSAAWLAMLVAAAGVYALLLRWSIPEPRT
jgi:hypothetical protein